MTYIMVDKTKFKGFDQTTKNLSRDWNDIKVSIQTTYSVIDWEVLASTNLDKTLIAITRSMDDHIVLLNKMTFFLTNTYHDYDEMIEEYCSIEGLSFIKNYHGNVKQSFLGITKLDLSAPFVGTNLTGTMLNAWVFLNTFVKNRFKDFDVIRSLNGHALIKESQGNGLPPSFKYQKGGEFISRKAAALAALRDSVGWLSIGIDVASDLAENKREPASKIIGDTLGNIFVGAGVNALGAAATIGIMSIPVLVSAPITTVVAVGFGVSVGLTYITEGIKWNVDLDNDDEDDSIKDMVKATFTNGLETVAGWFK